MCPEFLLHSYKELVCIYSCYKLIKLFMTLKSKKKKKNCIAFAVSEGIFHLTVICKVEKAVHSYCCCQKPVINSDRSLTLTYYMDKG